MLGLQMNYIISCLYNFAKYVSDVLCGLYLEIMFVTLNEKSDLSQSMVEVVREKQWYS